MNVRDWTRHSLPLLILASFACGGEPVSGSDDEDICGDGKLDSGETCDPGVEAGDGACPENCPELVCMTWSIAGAAEDCTAECVYQVITACADADDCCPEGCDYASDSDCMPQTGSPCPCENLADEAVHPCADCPGGSCYQTGDLSEHYCTEPCEATADCSHLEGEWVCTLDHCVREHVIDENHPPVIESFTASPSEVSTDGSSSLAVTASDDDGDELSYSYEILQGGGSL
ncbi:MAG: hypothetical protein ACOC0J_01325, partial [Myxococcota bacterium]